MRRSLLLATLALCSASMAFAQKGPDAPPAGPNLTAPARYETLTLSAGFMPDPREVRVQAGGELDAGSANLGPECVGFIDATRADVTLNYTAGQYPLIITAVSQADTTLVIRGPGGNWICNDDMDGLNPGVMIQNPAAGEYRIWVGTLSSGPAQAAVLRISEIAPGQGQGQAPAGGQPNIAAPARYATVNLTAGFMPDPHEVRVEAGGALNAAQARLGRECVGWIDAERADVTLNYTSGQYPLYISAVSRADTTLVIRAPDGRWLCNDDMEGLNPGVIVQNPASGEWRIWVGTLDRGQPQQATLRISEVPPRRR